MKPVGSLVVVAVMAAALSSCATSPAESPPSLQSLPSPTATQPSAAVYPAPERVFGGSCAALFTEAEVSEILGVPETLRLSGGGLGVYQQIPAHLGGMRCEWDGEYPGPSLVVVVMPVGVLTVPELDSCYSEEDYGFRYCPVDSTVNGIRISGAVLPLDDDVSRQAEAGELEAIFRQRAEGAAQVSAPVRSPTAWKSPCPWEQLQANPELHDLVVAEPAFIEEGLGSDGGYIPQPAEDDIYERPETAGWDCGFRYEEGPVNYWFGFTALGGGRWNEELLARLPGAVYQTVSGFDAVITWPDSTGDMVHVAAFIDDNWIGAYTSDPEATYSVLRVIVPLLR